MSDWLSKFSFLSPACVESDVGGTPVKFYAVKAVHLGKLRVLLPILGKSLAAIFEDKTADNGKSSTQKIQQDGSSEAETFIQGKSVEVIRFRTERLDRAVQDLLATVLDEKHQKLLAEILMDSMADQWDGVQKPTAEQFLAKVDVIQLREMLIGCAKANAKVFGNFQQAMAGFSARALAKLTPETVAPIRQQPPAAPASEEPSLAEAKPIPVDE